MVKIISVPIRLARLIEDGRLLAHKIGRSSYRIPEGAVKALLTQSLAKAFVDAFETALKEKQEERTR